jgi:hypothetical protein
MPKNVLLQRAKRLGAALFGDGQTQGCAQARPAETAPSEWNKHKVVFFMLLHVRRSFERMIVRLRTF